MRPLWWMSGVSLGTALAVAALPGFDSGREVLLGMLAPLLGAAATWVLAARLVPSRPELLTPLMMGVFGVKLVFFGAYVAVMLKVLLVRPMPFVVSFTAYFITLHLIEALCLQRLFGNNAPGPLRGTRPTYGGRVPPQADPPEW